MKTVKHRKQLEFKRVSDAEAEKLVASKSYVYCSKQEWKTNVRDFGKARPEESTPGKSPDKTSTEVKPKKTKKDKKDGK